MSTLGHLYRDDWHSGVRCWCHDLTDADLSARAAIIRADMIARAPHVMVTWSNAITTGQRVSECFAIRDDAIIAAASPIREPWNNTRVTMTWHEPHNRAAARRELIAAHTGAAHVWGVPCKACAAIEADRAESAAEVDTARIKAGDVALAVVTS